MEGDELGSQRQGIEVRKIAHIEDASHCCVSLLIFFWSLERFFCFPTHPLRDPVA